MISLTSQSKLGYAKYKMRKEGRAKRTVISMYKAKMAALAGIAYSTMRRNMTTRGNFADRWTKKTRDFRKEECILSILREALTRFWSWLDLADSLRWTCCTLLKLPLLTRLPRDGLQFDGHCSWWSSQKEEPNFPRSPFMLSTIQSKK